MKKNMHKIERVFRMIIGGILVTMAFIGPANPWFLLGLIPLLTGPSGNCPLYTRIKITTNPDDKDKSSDDHNRFFLSCDKTEDLRQTKNLVYICIFYCRVLLMKLNTIRLVQLVLFQLILAQR